MVSISKTVDLPFVSDLPVFLEAKSKDDASDDCELFDKPLQQCKDTQGIHMQRTDLVIFFLQGAQNKMASAVPTH